MFFDILEEAERQEIAEANKPPPVYYWSAGEEPSDYTATQKVRHNVHWAASKVWGGMRFVGEVVIKTFGLDQPEYQWMLDQVERDKERELENRRIKAERLAMIMEQQLKEEKEEADAEADQLE